MKLKHLCIILVLTALCASNVFAFAVSSSYHKNRPLVMVPGETANIDIKVQNMVGGGGDIIAVVEIASGKDIATLQEDKVEVLVPFNTFTTAVPIQVTIPQEAKVGEVREISIAIGQKSEGNGAPLSLSTSYRMNIPVQIGEIANTPEPIVEQPRTVDVNSIVTVVSVLLLLILFLLMMMYDKQRK